MDILGAKLHLRVRLLGNEGDQGSQFTHDVGLLVPKPRWSWTHQDPTVNPASDNVLGCICAFQVASNCYFFILSKDGKGPGAISPLVIATIS